MTRKCRICQFTLSGELLERLTKHGVHKNALGVPSLNGGIAYCPMCDDETLVKQDAPTWADGCPHFDRNLLKPCPVCSEKPQVDCACDKSKHQICQKHYAQTDTPWRIEPGRGALGQRFVVGSCGCQLHEFYVDKLAFWSRIVDAVNDRENLRLKVSELAKSLVSHSIGEREGEF